jgi:hypothetical protein
MNEKDVQVLLDTYKLVNKILIEKDPENLIKGGAPKNEYSAEAHKISKGLERHQPADLAGCFTLVWPPFRDWIGYKNNQEAEEEYWELSRHIFLSWKELKRNAGVVQR